MVHDLKAPDEKKRMTSALSHQFSLVWRLNLVIYLPNTIQLIFIRTDPAGAVLRNVNVYQAIQLETVYIFLATEL